MANVNDTVRANILAFPGLFETRADVVNFVLFVNGNGYEWVDGEPVTVFDENAPWSRAEADKKFELFWSGIGVALEERDRKSNAERNDALQYIVDTVEERVTTSAFSKEAIIREDDNYNLAAKAPENITADWAAALTQIRALRASA